MLALFVLVAAGLIGAIYVILENRKFARESERILELYEIADICMKSSKKNVKDLGIRIEKMAKELAKEQEDRLELFNNIIFLKGLITSFKHFKGADKKHFRKGFKLHVEKVKAEIEKLETKEVRC